MNYSTSIKAIDTPYKGHLFRSRNEARWAVFFDKLGLKWEYEVEGYELPIGSWYLPDFKLWTPQGNYRWIEIKGSHIDNDEKFNSFQEATGYMGVLATGTPLQWLEASHSICPRCGMPVKDDFSTEICCYCCDYETPESGPHPLQNDGVRGTSWAPHKGMITMTRLSTKIFSSMIYRAAIKAQSTRFEHRAGLPA